MTNLAGFYGIDHDVAWSMLPGEFEDVVAARAERDEWIRAQFGSVAIPVYGLGGVSVTIEQWLGRERDFSPDMVPGLERTVDEVRAEAMAAAAARREKRIAAREERRATQLLDPLEFDDGERR